MLGQKKYPKTQTLFITLIFYYLLFFSFELNAVVLSAANSSLTASDFSGLDEDGKVVIDALWEEMEKLDPGGFKRKTYEWIEEEIKDNESSTSSDTKQPINSEQSERDRTQEILRRNRQSFQDMKDGKSPSMSTGKGSALIEKMKAQNRAKLAQKQQALKEEQQKESENKEKQNSGSFSDKMRQKQNQTLTKWKEQERKTLEGWKQKVQETRNAWAKAREEFFKNLDGYKENSIPLPDKKEEKPISKRLIQKPVMVDLPKDFWIIPGAFASKVQDQGQRPTCAAFAGVRAMEILLEQNNRPAKLSEQYFYWSSKSDCRNTPCTKKGSWVAEGFRYGQSRPGPDIPLLSSCPYKTTSVSGNETQIPLNQSCMSSGKARVTSYERLETLDDIVNALKNSHPVIGGFKLSESFYKTKGLVVDSQMGRQVDEHAKGHAIILVGLLKLPPALQAKEGKVCFLVANSWGAGWGRGGYGCLTENWVKHYRFPQAFIAVKKVETI